MIDTFMYCHIQRYRQEFYETKAAVEQADELDVSREDALVRHQLATRAWVRRLLPLDDVEDMHQDIWHSRNIAGYEGLREAFEDGLQDTKDFETLSLDTLAKIGDAIDEITVDAVGLPPQPPVDPEPWTPPPTSELERLVEKYSKDIPHDLDSL